MSPKVGMKLTFVKGDDWKDNTKDVYQEVYPMDMIWIGLPVGDTSDLSETQAITYTYMALCDFLKSKYESVTTQLKNSSEATKRYRAYKRMLYNNYITMTGTLKTDITENSTGILKEAFSAFGKNLNGSTLPSDKFSLEWCFDDPQCVKTLFDFFATVENNGSLEVTGIDQEPVYKKRRIIKTSALIKFGEVNTRVPLTGSYWINGRITCYFCTHPTEGYVYPIFKCGYDYNTFKETADATALLKTPPTGYTERYKEKDEAIISQYESEARRNNHGMARVEDNNGIKKNAYQKIGSVANLLDRAHLDNDPKEIVDLVDYKKLSEIIVINLFSPF
jgi:hypothetical protein